MNNLAGVWANLIVCGSPGAVNPNSCGFADLIVLVKNVITDLTVLATLLVIIACVMIGVTLLTSQGSVTAKEKAKGMAWAVLKGYLIILAAWVLVYTISSALLAPGLSLISGIH
jgi:UPF0716 family protein affecting phage T7 exclusion